MKLEYVMTDIQELSFNKDIKEDIQLEIQAKSNYTVYYQDDLKSCIGELIIEIAPINNEEKLQVKYRSNSVFKLEDNQLNDEMKKEIHVEIYNRIFPLCCNHVANFLSMIGLPNIPINPIDFSQSEIIVNNM